MLRTEPDYPALFTDFLRLSEQQKQRWRIFEHLFAKDRPVALTRVLSDAFIVNSQMKLDGGC